MGHDGGEAGGEVPPFVKCLEDMGELVFGKAVEAGGDGVQFVDHVLLDVGSQRAVLDPDLGRPVGEPFVRRGKAAGESDSASADRIFQAGAVRNWDGGKRLIIDMAFNKPANPPITNARG